MLLESYESFHHSHEVVQDYSNRVTGKKVWCKSCSFCFCEKAVDVSNRKDFENQKSEAMRKAERLEIPALSQMLEDRLQRVQEVQSALEEATAAAMVLEPVAKRKLRKEIEKASLMQRTPIFTENSNFHFVAHSRLFIKSSI